MCVGIVGRVIGMLDPAQHVAEVEVDGRVRRVNAALVDDGNGLAPGAYVLINMGMAMEILEQEEALEHIRWVRELEES